MSETKDKRYYARTVYDFIKERYIEAYGEKGFFWEDFFKYPEEGLTWFLEELQKNEPWLDLTKEPSDEDLELVYDHIRDGLISSGLITKMVDSITDKFIGDS